MQNVDAPAPVCPVGPMRAALAMCGAFRDSAGVSVLSSELNAGGCPAGAGGPTESGRSRSWWLAAFVSALLVVFTCLFPAQTPFIQDEPMLVDLALGLNAKRQVAVVGLTGSVGRPYGPAALWFYQGLLAITHDPVGLMAVRIAIVSGTVAGALLALARVTRLTPWGVPLVLASPHVWFYSRHLWDNSLNLAVGAALFACYAGWLRSRRPLLLSASVVLTAIMLLIHLMATPVAMGIALHAIMRQRKALLAQWKPFVLGVTVALAMAFPYALRFVLDSSGYSTKRSATAGFWYPLMAPTYFSAFKLDYFFTSASEPNGGPASWLRGAGAWSDAVRLLTWPSVLAWCLIPMGLVGVADRCLVRRRRQRVGGVVGETDVAFEMALLSAITVGSAVVFHGVTQAFGPPYYYNATFAAYAVLLWFGLDVAWRFATQDRARGGSLPGVASIQGRGSARRFSAVYGRAVMVSVVGLYGASMLAIDGLLLARVMTTDGTRGTNFGPTLATQIEAAKRYGGASDLENQTDLFLAATRVMPVLVGTDKAGRRGPTSLRYASADPQVATLEVVELRGADDRSDRGGDRGSDDHLTTRPAGRP